MTQTTKHALRGLVRVVTAHRQLEGGGFEVARPFPSAELGRLDPFLLLDEMTPTHHKPGKSVGAPDHPHRGFETVSYLLDGEIEHKDSAGNHGVIGPGDVQWMTAGNGVVHSEMPSARIQREGGRSHGFQLWVNLPSALRRTPPRYQTLPAATLAQASGDGWRARVISGDLFGVTGPAQTHTPVGIAHLTLDAGATVDVDVADGHSAAAYAFVGTGTAGPDPSDTVAQLSPGRLAIFRRDSGAIRLTASAEHGLDALILTGEPLREPVARHGPFVMDTVEEIEQAYQDYYAGRMGSIPAATSVSR